MPFFNMSYEELYVGAITIISFVLTRLIQKKISSNLYISNALREEYDVCVLGIKRNDFIYNDVDITYYLKYASLVPFSNKYEVWYSEIFCNDEYKNIICSQLDNVVYTYYVYRSMKNMASIIAGFVSLILLTGLVILILKAKFLYAILVFMAFFDILQNIFEIIANCFTMSRENEKIINSVVSKYECSEDYENFIRCLQDRIVNNRDNSIFIPKYIRLKYLKNGNPYYIKLDDIKDKILGCNDSMMIEGENDIPILSADDTETLTDMSEIHNRLKVMLSDVIDVFEKHNIVYNLDGGTLISAVRESGKFIFWDDDIDIALPVSQIDKAKQALVSDLGFKYNIQDFEEDEFYSCRLSNMRIREKDDKSVVEEKDSPIFDLYKSKGLFIDVYVYSPIIYSKLFDSIYRWVWFYKLNKKLFKVESEIAYGENTRNAYMKFLKYNDIYKKRLGRYVSKAKCLNYYAYTPNYIESYKKNTVYVLRQDIEYNGDKMYFEGILCNVPHNAKKCLELYYGKNWNESPHKSKEELINKFGKVHWYSKNTFNVSSLKHLRYVTLK